jgi:hypothetical protein
MSALMGSIDTQITRIHGNEKINPAGPNKRTTGDLKKFGINLKIVETMTTEVTLNELNTALITALDDATFGTLLAKASRLLDFFATTKKLTKEGDTVFTIDQFLFMGPNRVVKDHAFLRFYESQINDIGALIQTFELTNRESRSAKTPLEKWERINILLEEYLDTFFNCEDLIAPGATKEADSTRSKYKAELKATLKAVAVGSPFSQALIDKLTALTPASAFATFPPVLAGGADEEEETKKENIFATVFEMAVDILERVVAKVDGLGLVNPLSEIISVDLVPHPFHFERQALLEEQFVKKEIRNYEIEAPKTNFTVETNKNKNNRKKALNNPMIGGQYVATRQNPSAAAGYALQVSSSYTSYDQALLLVDAIAQMKNYIQSVGLPYNTITTDYLQKIVKKINFELNGVPSAEQDRALTDLKTKTNSRLAEADKVADGDMADDPSIDLQGLAKYNVDFLETKVAYLSQYFDTLGVPDFVYTATLTGFDVRMTKFWQEMQERAGYLFLEFPETPAILLNGLPAASDSDAFITQVNTFLDKESTVYYATQKMLMIVDEIEKIVADLFGKKGKTKGAGGGFYADGTGVAEPFRAYFGAYYNIIKLNLFHLNICKQLLSAFEVDTSDALTVYTPSLTEPEKAKYLLIIDSHAVPLSAIFDKPDDAIVSENSAFFTQGAGAPSTKNSKLIYKRIELLKTALNPPAGGARLKTRRVIRAHRRNTRKVRKVRK